MSYDNLIEIMESLLKKKMILNQYITVNRKIDLIPKKSENN